MIYLRNFIDYHIDDDIDHEIVCVQVYVNERKSPRKLSWGFLFYLK